MNVKELDERPHEKCSDDGSDSGDGGYLRNRAAGKKEQYTSQDYAHDIGDDPDILELAFFPGVDDDQRNGVIS